MRRSFEVDWLNLSDYERHVEYAKIKATLASGRIHAVDDEATVIVFGSLGRLLKKVDVPDLHTFNNSSDIDLGVKPGQRLNNMADYFDYRIMVINAVQGIEGLQVSILHPLNPLREDRPGFLQEVERDGVVFS